jgi:hypothetical protein
MIPDLVKICQGTAKQDVGDAKRITPVIAAKKSSLFAGAVVVVLPSARTVLKKTLGVSAMVPPGSVQTANASI